MTYHYLKCPYCNKSLGTVTGSPDRLGDPFKKCPHCGKIYVDKFTREWANKSPFQRVMFHIRTPLVAALAALIGLTIVLFAALGQTMGNGALGVSIGIAVACAAALFCIIFFVRKPKVKKLIEQSIERTKYETYVTLLRNSNLPIYPIEGVEIGTIKDNSSSKSENTSEETQDGTTDASDNVA